MNSLCRKQVEKQKHSVSFKFFWSDPIFSSLYTVRFKKRYISKRNFRKNIKKKINLNTSRRRRRRMRAVHVKQI